MRRRNCNGLFWFVAAGALVLGGILLLFLVPAVVWLVLLAVLAGMGLTCLLHVC